MELPRGRKAAKGRAYTMTRPVSSVRSNEHLGTFKGWTGVEQVFGRSLDAAHVHHPEDERVYLPAHALRGQAALGAGRH